MSVFQLIMQVPSLIEFYSVEIASLMIFLVGFVTINKHFMPDNNEVKKPVIQCTQLKNQKIGDQTVTDDARMNYKFIEKLINNNQTALAEQYIAKNIPAPTVYIYSLLMKAYANERNLQKAQLLLESMENSKCKPNFVIYNNFLQCVIDSESEINIEKIFEQIQDKDIVTYSIFINYLFKKNKVYDVMQIFSQLVKSNFELDQKFFHVIIKGLLKSKEYSLTLKVYQVMKTKQFALNEYLVCAVIQLLTMNQKYQEAEQVFTNFGNIKNRHVNSQLIKMYYHSKNFSQLIQFFESIDSKEEVIFQQVIKSLLSEKYFCYYGLQLLQKCMKMNIRLRQNTYEEAIQNLFLIINQKQQVKDVDRQQAYNYLVFIFEFCKNQGIYLSNQQLQYHGNSQINDVLQEKVILQN